MKIFDCIVENFYHFPMLKFSNKCRCLIAIILSARERDKKILHIINSFFSDIDSFKDILLIGKQGLISKIKTVNFFNRKATLIFNLAEKIVYKFHNKIPLQYKELLLLPGIGRKTALVFLNYFSSDYLGIAVDTHVHRIISRFSNNFRLKMSEIENICFDNTSFKYIDKISYSLIEFGRIVCKIKPNCFKCIININCLYGEKTN